jgi:hypothetical protein
MKENNEAKTNSSLVIRCSYKGCTKTQNLRDFNFSDEEIIYYCEDHAYELGFCEGCGSFCGGLESFILPGWFGNIPGYCSDCSASIIEEYYPDSEEDEWTPDWDWGLDLEEDSINTVESCKPEPACGVSAASEEEEDDSDSQEYPF